MLILYIGKIPLLAYQLSTLAFYCPVLYRAETINFDAERDFKLLYLVNLLANYLSLAATLSRITLHLTRVTSTYLEPLYMRW